MYTLTQFFERPTTKLLQGQAMHNEKVQYLWTELNKYVFKRDLNDYSDAAHLTSFGIEFQTEKEAK